MLGTWKLRLFERGVEPGPADCVAKDDGHALTNEEVDRIARSLIEEVPPDDDPQRAEGVDSAPRADGSQTAH